jgi:hypothetical protein
MAPPRQHSDDDLERMIRSGMTITEIFGSNIGSTQSARVKKLARELGLEIRKADTARRTSEEIAADKALSEYFRSQGRKHLCVYSGIILIASDAHYWPGLVSPAHLAFLQFCRNLKPTAVVLNGDGFDGASISRYPRIGWDKKPTVKQELDTCKERMTEIEDACGTRELYWPLGNHDSRFETFLAQNAPQYEQVGGFRLKDHFPLWRPCWALWINDDTVIKHRWKGGAHAARNNTLFAGKTMVTGHLHSLKVTPHTDYTGTRWGVDTGTLAAPYGPQFEDYTEDSPVDWRSGFAVLTFHKGRLAWPETVWIDGDTIDWRGTRAPV